MYCTVQCVHVDDSNVKACQEGGTEGGPVETWGVEAWNMGWFDYGVYKMQILLGIRMAPIPSLFHFSHIRRGAVQNNVLGTCTE